MADGAGPSIWHRFCHTPGKVLNGDSGDIACDHYHRYKEDVALMQQLGMQAYRFSIAWGRVLPNGFGSVNKPGLDFYDRLVDTLLAANIVPMATLYHWDLPQALDEYGGWLNPDIAKWFGDFAEIMFNRLDDRVQYWITLNEPWVVADHGYLHGTHAPGHADTSETAIASHNLMQASAEAVRRYRAIGKHEIGIAINVEPKCPASQKPEDLAATQRADTYMNRQYLDAALLGHFPLEMSDILEDAWPVCLADQMGKFDEPLDFVGINYYARAVTRHAPGVRPLQAETVRQPQSTYTEMGWEVYPQAFTDALNWVRKRYNNPPVYVTENGSAFFDPPVARDNRIDDPLRQDYLCSHIGAVRNAISDGCDIRGYFAWSFMDNLEWQHGFSKRFGLVHVDYESLKRTPKESAKLYKNIIESNGVCLNT